MRTTPSPETADTLAPRGAREVRASGAQSGAPASGPTRMGPFRRGALALASLLLGAGSGGCAGVTARGPELVPLVAVEPRGLAQRLALMDRYRLHDEDRRRMMARPRVWVEELQDDELQDDGLFEGDARGAPAEQREANEQNAPAAEGEPVEQCAPSVALPRTAPARTLYRPPLESEAPR